MASWIGMGSWLMRRILPSWVIGAMTTAALRCTIVQVRGCVRVGVCTRSVTTSRCALANWRSLEIVFQPLSFTTGSVAAAAVSGKRCSGVSVTADKGRAEVRHRAACYSWGNLFRFLQRELAHFDADFLHSNFLQKMPREPIGQGLDQVHCL